MYSTLRQIMPLETLQIFKGFREKVRIPLQLKVCTTSEYAMMKIKTVVHARFFSFHAISWKTNTVSGGRRKTSQSQYLLFCSDNFCLTVLYRNTKDVEIPYA